MRPQSTHQTSASRIGNLVQSRSMTQNTRRMERDSFLNNSRPLNDNMASPTEPQSNPTAARDDFSFSAAYPNRSYQWTTNSIWGNQRTNGSVTETGLGDSPGGRQQSQRLSTSDSNEFDSDEFEGKTGSASLMNSSVVDETLGRTVLPSWRTGPSNSGRTLSAAPYPEPSILQPRNMSDAGLPQAAGNNTPLSLGFGISRPPTINLNNSSAFHNRPSIGSSFSSAAAGRDCEQKPPKVYTKFSRPSDPSQRKSDSAVMPWNEQLAPQSPADDRRPSAFALYGHNTNASASRESSLPPSRHANDQPMFNQPDFSRASQHITPVSSRAPSISSRNGAFGSSMASDPTTLSFSRMNLGPDSRPSTSYRSAGGHSSHPSGVSGISSVTRPSLPTPASEWPRQEYFSENDEAYTAHRQKGSHGSTVANHSHPTYHGANVPERHPSAPEFNPQSFQNFTNGNYVPRSPNVHGPQSSSFHGYQQAHRLQNTPEHHGVSDLRIQQLMAAQMRPNVAFYQPYINPSPWPVNSTIPPFVDMLQYPIAGIQPVAVPSHGQSANDVGSVLLQEFRSNSKSKRWELRDIYGHITLFVGDQHGSRFIQTKLETANSDEKEKVFQELEPNALQHMTDLFGNYVIQKFFEHGDQRHKRLLANKMHGQVLSLTLQMYGCRVVQKALEHVLVDQQAALIHELEHNVLKCVKDQNGNHVIQKAIERCPPASIGFIIAAFRGHVYNLSIHSYGCRVIQRCLEKCDLGLKALILAELMDSIHSMINDQYGNYVVQHIVKHDNGEAKQRVLSIVGQGLEGYSKHKFASNVVEMCLEQSDDSWRRNVIHALSRKNQHRLEGEDIVFSMIKDQFGNYVIQKILDTLNANDYAVFLDMLRPAMNMAKRGGCSKQTAAIEKKMYRYSSHHDLPLSGAFGQQVFPASISTLQYATDYSSAATTPPPALTADTHSFQSSRMPSVDGDTTEGATEGGSSIERPKLDGLSDHTTKTT